jgi:hypothetical protein
MDEAARVNRTFRPTATSEQDVSDFFKRLHVDKVPLPRSRVHVKIHLDYQDRFTIRPSSDSGRNTTLMCRSGVRSWGEMNRHSE